MLEAKAYCVHGEISAQGWVWLLEHNREMAHSGQAGRARARRSPLHVIFPSTHEFARGTQCATDSLALISYLGG